ncbi:PepSY domain-containing protein [Brevibacillus humidisoli]|uniref:PepSY-associated TM helix domain-containing protein n=1 Tax=Brevibacillus humidisoli TaxID=2895522 RepID=UPI001E3D3F22|nr:PepSY domain-containing protein [Brevibacillus humidisoli]UFJ41267.1 PepSY domain-containing protein [Brevibacillus humidisoli]
MFASTVRDEEKKRDQGDQRWLYTAVWRWHFYAGIIFAPFIIMLAVTGAIYLFKPQIEDWMYQDLYYVQDGQQQLTPSQQIAAVREAYPGAEIASYKPGFAAGRTSEVGLQDGTDSLTVFVNPYDGQIVGQLADADRLMGEIERLHGELMIGTVGDRMVELAACWAMILLVTGIYLWWPRDQKALLGTILPRLNKGGRTLWRDLHAVTAFWLSAFVALLILTGLPWSGVLGEKINQLATATNTGYPPFATAWGPKPESVIPAKEIAEVPWAAEQLPVPVSTVANETLPLEDVIRIAEERGVHPGYTITYPEGEHGVYTVSVSSDRPEDEATLHIDQYSGSVLSDLRFVDYGIMAKAIAIGIALHEGHYFGFWNQLIGLLTCIGLVAVVISGMIMWWKRRPSGKLGAPTVPRDYRVARWVCVIILLLGIVLPLAGISIVVALLLDYYVISKFPKIKQWVG